MISDYHAIHKLKIANASREIGLAVSVATLLNIKTTQRNDFEAVKKLCLLSEESE